MATATAAKVRRRPSRAPAPADRRLKSKSHATGARWGARRCCSGCKSGCKGEPVATRSATTKKPRGVCGSLPACPSPLPTVGGEELDFSVGRSVTAHGAHGTDHSQRLVRASEPPHPIGPACSMARGAGTGVTDDSADRHSCLTLRTRLRHDPYACKRFLADGPVRSTLRMTVVSSPNR
jgi:hypothetical protein